MKAVLAGDWHSKIHEEVICHALRKLGVDVTPFRWNEYFKVETAFGQLATVYLKFQNKFIAGPTVSKLNKDLISKVLEEQPEFLFIYRGSHVFPKTIRSIQKLAPNTLVVGYNNDDPFSKLYPNWMWRHFLGCIPYYDLIFAYRKHNIPNLLAAGAKEVELLRSWFVPEMCPPESSQNNQKDCDVIFIGHYEPDERVAYLEEVERRGWKLKIYGSSGNWSKALERSDILRHHLPIQPVWGEEYISAIRSARIALCFFSKLNRDGYTRRCFEIPACGTLLLSEHSEEMEELFDEDREAVFFKNIQDMSEKIEILMRDEEKRIQIACRGEKRVWKDGHDVNSRVASMLKILQSAMQKRKSSYAKNPNRAAKN